MHHYSLCFTKEGEMRFISHLDMLRAFIRALRRACIPVVYSQGFNPVPRLTFAAPLAVGMEGKNEYLDLFLDESREETHLKEALNKQLPSGLKIKSAAEVDAGQPTISSVIGAALYVAHLPDAGAASLAELQLALVDILQKKTLTISRPDKKGVAKNGGQKVVDQKGIAKKGVKEVNIRPFIYHLRVKTFDGGPALLMLLATGSQGGARPDEVLGLLPLGAEPRVYRQALFLWDEKKLKTPGGVSPDYYFGKNPMEI